MKKKTKKRIKKAAAKTTRGIFKLVLIYPIKGVWFLTKQLYYSIKEANQPKSNIKQTKKPTKTRVKKLPKKHHDISYSTHNGKVSRGKVKHAPLLDHFTEIKNKKGKLDTFHSKVYTNKSTIGLILGARGSGKSAVGMRMLENFKALTKKRIYALGFQVESLPKWITVINDIEDIQNDSVLLIDEGGIEFSSRKSMSDTNTFLSEVLLIARHKDLSVIFITQNSSNLEINVIRQADYLVLKPSSLLQKDFERDKIKRIYERAQEEFDELKDTQGLTYIYGDTYRGFVTNSLPSFWSDEVSKGYANK